MPTMYETIQGLPLFQGTTTEQISAFLEKTNVEFIKFYPGQIIAEVGEECTDIKFVISGTVETCMSIAQGQVSLCTHLGPNSVLSAANLFGMYTQYHKTFTCLTEGSYMKIRKSQYFDLLKTAPIYLLNYINFLSYQAQRARIALSSFSHMGLRECIELWRYGYVDRHAMHVSFSTTKENLSEILNLEEKELIRTLDELVSENLIEYSGDLTVTLKN
ncbi:MAG: Crp/Fnr family transcriptional regulator [Prevotella sp.]|nr:Crp/Fnr family transcriptional regulator [Prevotella sp.]MCM1074660.1 Crp/Fnr family transcriptional regulator [Ruminococcus sp.]